MNERSRYCQTQLLRLTLLLLIWLSHFLTAFTPPLLAQTTPSFVYVTNNVIGNVSIYRIGPGGTLTTVGTTPPRTGAASIVATPDHRHLYVANHPGSAISGFSINPVTGQLTPVPGSPYAFAAPSGLAVHPNGAFLFVSAISPPQVASFRIDPVTGSLTEASTLGVAGNRLAINPDGRFLYLPNSLRNTLEVIMVNDATGDLSLVSTYDTGRLPIQAIVHPSGKFVYATNGDNPPGSISGYIRTPTTGLLTPMIGSPFPMLGSWTMTVDPNGLFAYASAWTSSSGTSFGIATLSIDAATGSLAVAGPLIPTRGFSYFSAFDPSGKYLFLPGYNATEILGYQQSSPTGALLPVPGSPFPSADLEPVAIAVVGGRTTVQPVVYPNRGGNNGPVTVNIVGGPFAPGVKIKLTGIGADIVAAGTSLLDASTLTTTFDLKSASPGPRTLTLENPGQEATALPQGFNVEPGNSADVWIDLVGRTVVRVGRGQTVMITFGNRGNVDSGRFRVWISFPSYMKWELNPIFQNASAGSLGETTFVAFDVQRSTPGVIGVIPIRISAPDGEDAAQLKPVIKAWINKE